MEPLLVVVVVATGLVAAGEGGSALRPSRPITNVVHGLLEVEAGGGGCHRSQLRAGAFAPQRLAQLSAPLRH